MLIFLVMFIKTGFTQVRITKTILRGDFMDNKQLEKSLKVLSWFNRPRRSKTLIFDDKIFVHNDLMYATYGKIFCWTKNQTGIKDFCFFKGKKFEFYDPKAREVREVKEALRSVDNLERIIKMFNYYPLEFDVDFSDYPLPFTHKLMGNWKNRYDNSLFLDFETAEATFKFCGGEDKPGGVTGIYGDIVKNLTGTKTDKIGFPMFYLKVMDVLKVKKIHFKFYPERRHLSFKIGNYNFLAVAYN